LRHRTPFFRDLVLYLGALPASAGATLFMPCRFFRWRFYRFEKNTLANNFVER
jgi:hypothetical protein